MQKEFEKFSPATLFEGMTSLRAIFLARQKENPDNDRRIIRLFYAIESERRLAKELSWLRHRAEEDGFPMIPLPQEELSAMATGNTHGGILAECTARTIPNLCDGASLPARGFLAMADGIEDPYNFGYALRSLYAAGADGVILPERNWMSAAGVVARASAGASELLPLFTADPLSAADFCKERGFCVVCADTRTDLLLPDAILKKPILLIVGGEKRGISRALLDRCDFAVKIPYAREFNASLSAASATTMLAYEIMRQNR